MTEITIHALPEKIAQPESDSTSSTGNFSGLDLLKEDWSSKQSGARQESGDRIQPPIEEPPGDLVQLQIEEPSDASGVQLNPKFKDISNEDLERLAMMKSSSIQTVPEAKEAFNELIKRYDRLLPPGVVQTSKDSIKLLQQALEAGKDVTAGPDGKPALDDSKPLTEERRFQFHQAIMGDIETMNNQARIRLTYAQFLRPAGQLADSEKMGKDAVKFSDALPIDILKKENQLVVADLDKISDPAKKQAMLYASQFLTGQDSGTGVINMPINSRKSLAQFYLGTEVTPKVDSQGNIVGIESIDFGRSASFDPEKAYEIAKETREKTKEILGFDPIDKEQAGKNPDVASLFPGLTQVFKNPDKYNLYKVTDAYRKGKDI